MVSHSPGYLSEAPDHVPHPMRQVVGFVQDRRAVHSPRIPWDLLHEGVAHCGLGMDYPAGEQVLVALKHGHDSGRLRFHTTLIVTDRRLFGRDHAGDARDDILDIPFAQVVGSRLETKLLVDELHVQLRQGWVKLTTFGKELAPFFQGLARVPLEYRAFAPAAPAASGEDPTGARGAEQRLQSGDVRVRLVLRAIHEAARAGALSSEEGLDLVTRAALFDRELRTGRGMSHEFWLSTMPRAATLRAMVALLGEPSGHHAGGPTDTLDFPAAGDHRVARAAASSAVGLALAATVGIGWVSVPRGRALRGIRVTACDFPCGSGFALRGTTDGRAFDTLSRTSPQFVDSIHQALLRIEARWLLARCTLGGGVAPEKLLWPARAAIEARLAALGMPADVSAFFPPPDGG